MKQPSQWSQPNSKNPGAWSGAVKTAVAWLGSSLTKTDAPASNWDNADIKTADQWTVGHYTYDSFLAYDSYVTYDGQPDPAVNKSPSNWSTV